MYNCNGTSFLNTSQFLAYFLHLFGCFAIPLHFFGGYCILYKTPLTMSSIKWSLLNFHFWSCFLDCTMSLLVTPYLFLPTLGGYTSVLCCDQSDIKQTAQWNFLLSYYQTAEVIPKSIDSPAIQPLSTMSYCTESFFFDTAEFQAFSLHFFGFIAIPMHLLGAYCILFKTPPAMKSVKWSLMNFHFWSCFLDLSLSLFTTPYILLPALAGYPLGLSNYFGVGTAEQIMFVMITVGVLLVSMTIVFETRLLVLFNMGHWWRRVRIPWFIFDLLVAFVYFIPFYLNVPDQSILMEILLKRLSCVPEYVHLGSVYLFSSITAIPSTVVSLVIAFLMYQTVIFTLLTGWLLSRQIKKSISINTVKMQKKFLKALILQMVIPGLILLAPAFYLVCSVWMKFHRQYLNNVCLIAISSHGMSTTVVMLLIHAPYREFLLQYFKFRGGARIEKANSAQNMETVLTRV